MLYYRVDGWPTERNGDCLDFAQIEIECGPLAPGDVVSSYVGQLASSERVPFTVAFWDKPCGERCSRAPIGAFVVGTSPEQPHAS